MTGNSGQPPPPFPLTPPENRELPHRLYKPNRGTENDNIPFLKNLSKISKSRLGQAFNDFLRVAAAVKAK